MAKRKKRAKPQSKKPAKLRRGSWVARRKAGKGSKQRSRTKKRTIAGAKSKHGGGKKAARKNQQRIKRPSPAVETVVVDVVEEPVPGVITVTEFEETQVTRTGLDQTEDDDNQA